MSTIKPFPSSNAAAQGRIAFGPVLLALLASAGSLGLFGCSKKAPVAQPPPVVQVMEIVDTNAPASVEFIGQLDSPQSVGGRAGGEAFAHKMAFTEGTEVKGGEPLFQLDNNSRQERLAAANRALAEAKAGLNKSD